jgi:peptide chain release factor 1
MQFAQKLEQLEKRFEGLTTQMADPQVIADAAEYRKVSKAHSDLSEIVGKYREWKRIEDALSQARAMLQDGDSELVALAEEETARLEPELAGIEEQLKILLLPKDPNDEKNVVLEIRAGTGGGGHVVCRRDIPHVFALRGDAELENGSDFFERVLGRRPQGSDRPGQRQ